MTMHKNTSIIMAPTIAAILTTSILAFALSNRAFAQPVISPDQVIFSPLGSVAGGAAHPFTANVPGLALSAAGGAEPSFGVQESAQGLALKAAGGAAHSFTANVPGLALSAGSGSISIKVGAPLVGVACPPSCSCSPYGSLICR
jgi:hypothetical protein